MNKKHKALAPKSDKSESRKSIILGDTSLETLAEKRKKKEAFFPHDPKEEDVIVIMKDYRGGKLTKEEATQFEEARIFEQKMKSTHFVLGGPRNLYLEDI